MNVLDFNGLIRLVNNIKNLFATKTDLASKQDTLTNMTSYEASAGAETTARSISAKVLDDKITEKIGYVNTGVLSVSEGTTDGTLSVDGIDTPVHGLQSGAFTTAYNHPTTEGNKHIPSGGSSGQILRWSAAGTAAWGADNDTTVGSGITLTGYTKPSTSSAIAATDTVNEAIGKLEAGKLDPTGTAARATADASGNVINTTYATKSELSAIPKFAIEVVNSLPTTDISSTTVYLLLTSSETQNLYTEYIYVNNAWEKLGSQTLDLSGYALKSDITTGSTNGTIAVDGTDVPVAGLQSGAFNNAYVHPTTSGNNHIPAGGSSGQILKWTDDGTATWGNEYSYTLPTAASDTLGGIQVGSNLSIDENGVLSAVGDVTTDTAQNIIAEKTFVGEKRIKFKQSTNRDKLGFTLYMNNDAERGYLEFNPTNTTDGITGLLSLGNYATTKSEVSQVGFRRYSSVKNAEGAYNLLMPLIVDARTPFELVKNVYTNFYLTLGVTDGTTMVTTAKSGVLDISPLIPSLSIASASTLGGIKVGTNLSIDPSTGELSATDTVYTHPTTSGNNHIPSGGSSGQILKWSADGIATWSNETTYDTMTASEATTGTSTDGKLISPKVLNDLIDAKINSIPVADNMNF